MGQAHEGIFKSAAEAVQFALRHSASQFPQSQMGKILQQPGIGQGRGLVGLDGAAQAGMVLAELQNIPSPSQLAVVYATSVPKIAVCHCGQACCRGWTWTPEFSQATAMIGRIVAENVKAAPNLTKYLVGVVRKHFGGSVDLALEAELLGIAPKAALAHATRARKYLGPVEDSAWQWLSNRLTDVGMVESAAEPLAA